jgi:hypothetical protein
MKFTLFLLAAMIGAVCGVEIGAEIVYKVGEPSDVVVDPPCSTEKENIIYETCVVEVAKRLGINLSRRLELRGGRELTTISLCSFCRGSYPRGTYCFTRCTFNRRLTVSDEHTQRFLCSQGKVKRAADDCIEKKINDKDEDFVCLGNSKDIEMKIFLSE